MAKKKRLVQEEQEEAYEFTPSNFDEREFILKEKYGTKVMIIYLIFAFIIGFVAALLWKSFHESFNYIWVVDTLIVFLFMGVSKKILVAFGVRADMLETRAILMDYFLYMTLALGACIMFINAPFLG